MLSLKLSDRAEKGILVRVGTVIDGIINSQRGHSNSGAKLDPRKPGGGLKKPPNVVGATENIFNGIAITIDPIRTSTNLSSYEIQVDDNAGFSDPFTKVTFNKSMIFKGLTAGTTYYIRARGLTKTGEAGDWVRFGNVTTTVSAQNISSDITGLLGSNSTQAQSRNMVTNFSTEDFFCAANFGLVDTQDGGGSGGEGGGFLASQFSNTVTWLGGINYTYTVGLEANKILDSRVFVNRLLTEESTNVSAAGYYDEEGNYVPAVSNEVQLVMRTNRMPTIAFFDLFNPATGTAEQAFGPNYDTVNGGGWSPIPGATYPMNVVFKITVDNTFSSSVVVEPCTYVLF
jgi:hypothetical protein